MSLRIDVRRRSKANRSYSEGLLTSDHLFENDNAAARRQNRYQSPSNATYKSPSLGYQPDLDKLPIHRTVSSVQRSLLYYTAPEAPSVRRALVTQTPKYVQHGRAENDFSPSQDLVANSLLSYGCCCCQCVRTTEIGVVEDCGKYSDLLEPGFHCLMWPFSDISGRMSLRIQQIDIVCETRTQDSVFCDISVSIPFRIIAESAYDAYYRLSDPTGQIKSFLFNVIRSTVPTMTVDEVFLNKNKIAAEVSKELEVFMVEYGYEILQVLVTDVRPAASVRQSMNEMNASKRLKIAMAQLAEAEKYKIIKEAEADAECRYLRGVGISGQRRAFVQELRKSFNEGRTGVNNAEVMNLLLVTQYNDLIETISSSTYQSEDGQSHSLLMNCNPGHVRSLIGQVQSLH